MHYGHIRHLEAAKAFGDRLVVSVVPDKYVAKRVPVYAEDERVAMLKALRCVSNAILCDGPGPEVVIERIRPDVYVRGEDYVGKTMPESALLAEMGIHVRYTKSVPPRTSEIIERVQGIKCL